MDKKLLWYLLVVFLALSFLLYGNTIAGQFVSDDALFTYRSDLKDVSSLANLWLKPYLPDHREAGVWRPFATFSTSLQFILFGVSPVSFHIRNIVLNGLASFLVLLIMYELFHNKRFSMLSSLLFAFFPVHTEAVAYSKSGEDLWGALFFLLSWMTFLWALKGKSVRRGALFGSVVLALLSVLSKETFIFGPILIIMVSLLVQKTTLRKIIHVGWWYMLGMFGYTLVRFIVLGKFAFGNDDASFVINPIRFADGWTRIWTAFHIGFIYIQSIIAPVHLSANYHYAQVPLVHTVFGSWQSVFGIVSITLLVFVAFFSAVRSSPWGVGAMVFLIPYFVVSKFIITGGELMAERWMYIPSVGFAILGGYLFDRTMLYRKILGAFVFIVLLCWYTSIIIPRNRVWSSNRALIESKVRDAPRSVHARFLLAELYLSDNNLAKAQEQAEIGIGMYADYAPLITLRGAIFAENKQYEEAKRSLLKSAKIDPTFFPTFSTLAKVYFATGEIERAISVYNQIIPKSFGKLHVEDYVLYALSLAKNKQYQKSIDVVKNFIGTENITEVRFVMAVNYYRLGDMEKAKSYFDWVTNVSESEKIRMVSEY